MKNIIIKAASAQVIEDLNSFVVALAQESDGSGHRFEVQRALSFDDQDRALGMDTYCLVTSWGGTHYGGVDRYALRDECLLFEFNESAADALNTERAFELTLRLDKDKLSEIEGGLCRALVLDPVSKT